MSDATDTIAEKQAPPPDQTEGDRYRLAIDYREGCRVDMDDATDCYNMAKERLECAASRFSKATDQMIEARNIYSELDT